MSDCPKCENKGYRIAYDGITRMQCEACNGSSARPKEWGMPPPPTPADGELERSAFGEEFDHGAVERICNTPDGFFPGTGKPYWTAPSMAELGRICMILLHERAALESKPCPYVVTSDEGTSHCALAQNDDDAARYRWLRDRGHVNGWRVNFPGDTRNSRLWVSGQSLDHAIDKELHKSAGGGGDGH